MLHPINQHVLRKYGLSVERARQATDFIRTFTHYKKLPWKIQKLNRWGAIEYQIRFIDSIDAESMRKAIHVLIDDPYSSRTNIKLWNEVLDILDKVEKDGLQKIS